MVSSDFTGIGRRVNHLRESWASLHKRATKCHYYPDHPHEHEHDPDFDEPGEASRCPYETTHTDWDQELPHIKDIHRGLGVTLPQHLHDAVHDESKPMQERAKALSDHLTGNLGMHWTDNSKQAEHYVDNNMHSRYGDAHTTGVVLHAHTPAKEHIETDPDELEDRRVIGFDYHEDHEIPMHEGSPVKLKGISWTDGNKWNHHMFDSPQEHTASQSWAALHMAGDVDEYGHKEAWKPGDRAHFEYHCNEDHNSPDAKAWYHSHRQVTVLDDGFESTDAPRDSTYDDRVEGGTPKVHTVRHDDGFEHDAFEDELLTHPRHFDRSDPPEGPQ